MSFASARKLGGLFGRFLFLHLPLIAALLVEAGQGNLTGLAFLYHQEPGTALRALLGNRLVPGSKGAFGIIAATPEGLPPLRPSFHNVSTVLGTFYAGGDGFGGLAFRIPRTGKELAETA